MEMTTAAEFDAKHAGDDGYIIADGWLVFSDGARRTAASFDVLGPTMAGPPEDLKKLRGWQIIFWQARLEDLVDKFSDCRSRAKGSTGDGSRFDEKMAELKTLQSKIRSARSKLSYLTVQERGFCQSDVERAWECWRAFSEACAVESHAKAKFDSAMLGKSSAGVLEKLKRSFDLAKKQSERAMHAWNTFTPVEARSIVSEELDQRRRAERESELDKIEV